MSSYLPIMILIAMTFIGATASLFLKKAADSLSIRKVLRNKKLYIGLVLYFISALFNIKLLSLWDYSVVLPLTSITYIWTMILAYFFLNEKIGFKKIYGIVAIIIGVFLIAI